MSADNGIYIAKFNKGYRVIHAQAIDNLNYFPRGSQEEKDEWRDYFSRAPLIVTEAEALTEAARLLKEHRGFVEYGISFLPYVVEFEEENSTVIPPERFSEVLVNPKPLAQALQRAFQKRNESMNNRKGGEV